MKHNAPLLNENSSAESHSDRRKYLSSNEIVLMIVGGEGEGGQDSENLLINLLN